MSNHPLNTNSVLEQLSQVTDITQFLNGVKDNPDIIFNAVKELTKNHKELRAATSVLQTALHELSEKNLKLSKAAAELDLAQQKIRKLEKKVSSSALHSLSPIDEALNRFADILGKRQAITEDHGDSQAGIVFNGDKKKLATWKEGILMRFKSNPS